MAALNEVESRIDIRGKCEVNDLEAALGGTRSALVVCDVEGYEEYLLDPIAAPSLRAAAILAEMHDFACPGVTKLLQARFEVTHNVVQVHQAPRYRDEFPWRTFGTKLLAKSYLDWAVSEWRPVTMSWLWMEPRTEEISSIL